MHVHVFACAGLQGQELPHRVQPVQVDQPVSRLLCGLHCCDQHLQSQRGQLAHYKVEATPLTTPPERLAAVNDNFVCSSFIIMTSDLISFVC